MKMKSHNSKQYARENSGLKPDRSKATRTKRTITKEKKVNDRRNKAY